MLRTIMTTAACAGSLAACSLPVYQPGPSDKVARVKSERFGSPLLCIGRQTYVLNADSNGYFVVPADRPVHLTGLYYGTGMCTMGVVFVPKSGQVYQIVNELRAEHCVVSVTVRDPSAEYGFRVDPLAVPARPSCN